MAPLAVDPQAMYAAGTAVVAIGDGLAASLTILTAGFSAHTGIDLAGEMFGLAYQDAAKSLLKAAAAAVNACRKTGAIIQQGAANYSNVDAASTLGGGGGVLQPPSPPAELAAPGPPGTMGPGEPAPSLWWLVQSLVHDVWPDGDVAGLRAAAARWRGFAAAAGGVEGILNASKTLFDSQHIPEADLIDHALTEIGTAAKNIGEQCGKLATTIDKFANRVEHAQNAIRDLLHRLESLADIGHDVMLIIEGKALDEVEKIAKDINDVLGQLGQEARAYEQGIKLLMKAADGEIVKCQKYARRALVQFLGADVGNPVATVFETWFNVHEGLFKDAVNTGLGLADLSPHWFLVDPQGAAATWTGMGKGLWKGSLFNAAVDPQEFAAAKVQELKGLVHAEDWTGDRPGLGAGEIGFDVGTLAVPLLGEVGPGAGAAARGAEEGGEAAGAAAGGGGKATEAAGGLVGARGALTDITETGGNLTKNLEGLPKDLPKIEPPASGAPVALPPGKPFEAPVESGPRPPDAAPGAPQGSTPTTAPPGAPGGPGGPHDPAPVPAPASPPGGTGGAGGPPDPGPAPAPASAGGSAGDPGGPFANPNDLPPEPPPAPAHPPETPLGPEDAGTAPPTTPAGTGDPNDPRSVPPGGPHEPPPEPAGVPHEPATVPTSAPVAVPAGVGEGLPKAVPHLADPAAAVPSASPSQPALVSAHAPQPAGASAPSRGAPSFTAPSGHPSELPSSGGGGSGWHGSGDGGPAGGDSSGKPSGGDGDGHGGKGRRGKHGDGGPPDDDDPPKDGSDDKTPDDDDKQDEPTSQDLPQDADKPAAGRDYPLSPEQALQVLSDPQNEVSRLANGKVPTHMLENYDPLAGRTPEEFARDFTIRDPSGKLKWDWENQAPNNGFAGKPEELDHIPARLRLDRVGPNGGAFMSQEGEPLANRATPPGLASQYHSMSGSGDTVPDNWVVQHGPAKAAFGQPGGAEQWVVIDRITGQPIPVEELDIAGVITDLTP